MMYAITVEPGYAEAIAKGQKQIELRTRIPRGLKMGDIIVVCVKGAGGRVACWFEVGDVLCLLPATMWYRYGSALYIDWFDYWDYVGEREHVYGIVIRCVFTTGKPLNIRQFGLERAPQWFSVAPVFPSAYLNEPIKACGGKEVRNAATI